MDSETRYFEVYGELDALPPRLARTITGMSYRELRRFAGMRPVLRHRSKALGVRRMRVAEWLAWKRHGGPPDEYVDIGECDSCLDGWFTPSELRRIAAVIDEYRLIMGEWPADD